MIHQPPGWRIINHQGVIDELLERAGKPDLEKVEKTLAPLREKFSGPGSRHFIADGG
jgi:hypothetical protein